jgi:hypothetical protein
MEEINNEIGLDAMLRRAGAGSAGRITPNEKEEKVPVVGGMNE